MNLKIFQLITCIITSILLFSNIVFALPAAHQFYGTVTVSGNPAQDGIAIVAKVGGNEFRTTTLNGKYGYEPVFIIQGDSEWGGETIYFFIDGNKANENYKFCLYWACRTELNLTVTIGQQQGGNTGGSTGGATGGITGGQTQPLTNQTSATQNITCTEEWSCSKWSECKDNFQTRACTDLNKCGTEKNKPFESPTLLS